MKRKYILLAALMIILALGLALLPGNKEPAEIEPGLLLSSVVEKSRYLTVDQVTQRIVENDPALLLIDLRPENDFKTFILPGAVHVNPDSLLSGGNLELFRQPGKDKVLFSNADLVSEKAWLICTRFAMNRVYIMKGGMNEWFNTIINVQDISGTPSSADLDLISFRKAARQFFIGPAESAKMGEAPAVRQPVALQRKAPRARSGGGC